MYRHFNQCIKKPYAVGNDHCRPGWDSQSDPQLAPTRVWAGNGFSHTYAELEVPTRPSNSLNAGLQPGPRLRSD